MHTHLFHPLSRFLAVGTLMVASNAALAGDGVYWSVNVNAPLQGMGSVGTTVSNTRHGVMVGQHRTHDAPPVVVYMPPAVVVHPRPVYAPGAVVHLPPRVVTPWGGRHHGWAWGHGRHHHHGERMAWGHGRGDDHHDGGHGGRDGYERGDRDGHRGGHRGDSGERWGR